MLSSGSGVRTYQAEESIWKSCVQTLPSEQENSKPAQTVQPSPGYKKRTDEDDL